MGAPKDVAEPHKELRFTRAGQAQVFYVLGAVLIAVGVILAVTWWMGHPAFGWWMPLLAWVLAGLVLRVAVHCTRHAYVILTPLGVEVFPFLKPEKNLMLMYWGEIEGVDFDENRELMRLHRDAEKTSGVVVSLKPVLEGQRPLLEKAILGRIEQT